MQYVDLLVKLNHPLFLASAYDIWKSSETDRKSFRKLLDVSYMDGRALIIDSGNYEKYWNQDYQAFLKDNFSFHYAFSFDDHRDQNTISPNHIIVNEVEKRVKREQQFSEASVLPIVHAPLESIIAVVSEVVSRLNPIMVAVPERELGSGIIEKVKTLRALRDELNKTGQYYPLHLLGTGNPLSMLIYAKYGADSFDDWNGAKLPSTINQDFSIIFNRESFSHVPALFV
jgi:hypothetical protein